MNRLRRRWAVFGFTRRDAVMYGAMVLGLAVAALGGVTGWHWLYAVTWGIFGVVVATGLWYGARIVVLLAGWRRDRKAAMAAARARTEARRDGVLNPDGGAVLVADTSALTGDERIDIGGGRTVRVADLTSGADVIEVQEPKEDR